MDKKKHRSDSSSSCILQGRVENVANTLEPLADKARVAEAHIGELKAQLHSSRHTEVEEWTRLAVAVEDVDQRLTRAEDHTRRHHRLIALLQSIKAEIVYVQDLATKQHSRVVSDADDSASGTEKKKGARSDGQQPLEPPITLESFTDTVRSLHARSVEIDPLMAGGAAAVAEELREDVAKARHAAFNILDVTDDEQRSERKRLLRQLDAITPAAH